MEEKSSPRGSPCHVRIDQKEKYHCRGGMENAFRDIGFQKKWDQMRPHYHTGPIPYLISFFGKQSCNYTEL